MIALVAAILNAPEWLRREWAKKAAATRRLRRAQLKLPVEVKPMGAIEPEDIEPRSEWVLREGSARGRDDRLLRVRVVRVEPPLLAASQTLVTLEAVNYSHAPAQWQITERQLLQTFVPYNPEVHTPRLLRRRQ